MANKPENLKPFVKGHDPRRNLKGKPIGTRSYKTIFEEAVRKVALDDNIDPDTIERDIIITGLLRAKKGDYNFYRDTLDRVYGKVKDELKVEGGVTVINEYHREKAKKAIEEYIEQ